MLKTIGLMTVAGLLGTAVFAADYTWDGSSGAFQTDTHWSPVGVPGAADNAKFTTAGTYAVSFNGDATNRYATVGASGDAHVSFELAGFTWRLTNNLVFANTGTVRFGGGTLEVGVPFQPFAGASNLTVPGNQKLILDSGSARLLGPVNVSSGGAIEVNGGDHMLAWSMGLNPPPTGGASFRMTGGRLTMTNNDNYARCSLWNGSRIALEGGTLSVRYQVDINGIPSAPAVIDIYTNATLLQNPGIGFNVSRTGGGLGIVNILGGSLLLSNSNCNVVNMNSTRVATTGIVNLVDGKFLANHLTFGYTSNAVAIVRQSGGWLQMTGDTFLGKEKDSLGVLTQEGGEAWYNQFYVGGFSNGVGEVNLAGGSLAVAGSSSAVGKIAHSTGRLLQSGGDLIISNTFAVGNAKGAFGVITNTGGSFWLNNTLNVGNSGMGAFGRTYFSGPSNYVKSAINVGNNTADRGELIVAGGQLVSDGAVTVGSVLGSTGMVSVTGGTALFKGFTVGQYGQGALFVSGGVLAVTNGGALVAGNFAGSEATVLISGGTNLFLGQGITIGQFGSGFMRIEGGYTYTTNRFVVGGGSNGVGRLELCGGILSTPIIGGRDMTLTNGNPGGYSSVLFDGGTLQHSVDGESWMPGGFVSTFGKATLTDRGAVIDSNGDILAIPQALSNEVGYAGSFTKTGAGKLTLSSWFNAFTGRVAVEQGELAVSGGIYLSGGVAIDPGAWLNLSGAGSVRGTLTDPGTVSRIDGALTLKSGTVLTNGVGAVLGGSGVVTGSVVFASGSAYGRDKAGPAGALRVTGNIVFEAGVPVRLTGYTEQDLKAGVPLLTADASGTLEVSGALPVTLDGASYVYWWAKVSADGKTLSARYIPNGTMISVR